MPDWKHAVLRRYAKDGEARIITHSVLEYGCSYHGVIEDARDESIYSHWPVYIEVYRASDISSAFDEHGILSLEEGLVYDLNAMMKGAGQ